MILPLTKLVTAKTYFLETNNDCTFHCNLLDENDQTASITVCERI